MNKKKLKQIKNGRSRGGLFTLKSDWSIWIRAGADNTTLHRGEEFCGKSLSFASLKPETFVYTTEDIFKHVWSEPQNFNCKRYC